MEIKEALDIDYENDSTEDIIKKIEFAIEQHPSFSKVISKHEMKNITELDKKRKW
jgi:hypothetical protein